VPVAGAPGSIVYMALFSFVAKSTVSDLIGAASSQARHFALQFVRSAGIYQRAKS
jgi:hypothetical protein